ncbi:MAG TPA: PKD domain-containing protein, partial [Thermoplasmata archaeon]|nr:PKD domain-containing protein [Thermoplasmata archaeon]
PAVFDASASVDPDGTIVSYSWTFGDGAVGSGAVTTHAYSASGTYPVTLTVVDDESNQDVATGSIIVNSAPIIISKFPTASIILELNLSTTLTIFVSDADDDSLTYTWQVNGVVAPSNGRSFEFRAGAEGTYSVTVTVSDGSLSDSDEWIVAVVGRGTASPPFVWWIPALVVIGGVSIILALWLWRRQR